MEWIFIKMVLSLGAVLALMFVVAYLLKRFVVSRSTPPGSGVQIEVLGRKMLQPKKSVVVLRVGPKVLVVGMSDHGLQTLTELPDPAPGQDEETTLESRPRAGASFAVYLQKTLHTLVGRPNGKVNV